LDRGYGLGLLLVRRVDKAEQLALRAQQDDASAPFHPAGKLAGSVLAGAAAGRHER
jgi:hypothetical protein